MSKRVSYGTVVRILTVKGGKGKVQVIVVDNSRLQSLDPKHNYKARVVGRDTEFFKWGETIGEVAKNVVTELEKD